MPIVLLAREAFLFNRDGNSAVLEQTSRAVMGETDSKYIGGGHQTSFLTEKAKLRGPPHAPSLFFVELLGALKQHP